MAQSPAANAGDSAALQRLTQQRLEANAGDDRAFYCHEPTAPLRGEGRRGRRRDDTTSCFFIA